MRCWRKANILPATWDCDINNAVGSASLSVKDKSLSKDACEELCAMMHKLQTKATESGPLNENEAYGLSGSFVGEGTFGLEEMVAMVKNWVLVEDNPVIMDTEVDDAIEALERDNSASQADDCDDDEPETMAAPPPQDDSNNKIAPPTSFAEAQTAFDTLKSYFKAIKLPDKDTIHLDRLVNAVRAHSSSRPTTNPTLHRFFRQKNN
jgi:hypothetical protein